MDYVCISFILLYVLVCRAATGRIQRQTQALDNYNCCTPNNEIGNCRNIYDCQPMTDLLNTRNPTTLNNKEKDGLLKYKCEPSGNDLKVCCPNNPITFGWLYDDQNCTAPDGSTSTCIDINNCKVFSDFINGNENFSEKVKQAMKKYRCKSNESKVLYVCCPSKLPDFVTIDHSKHSNVKLLPTSLNCGISQITDKIIGGNETGLFEYPWAAALKYDIKNEHNPFKCGGSLISQRYVLTAAHCLIKDKYKLIGVRLGEHNFDTAKDCDDSGCAPDPQNFDISSNDIIIHPDYNPCTLENDIGLIRLRSPANITVDSVLPVCLPTTVPEKIRPIVNYTVIGWGNTDAGFPSKVLLKAYVPKVENPKCAPLYKNRVKFSDRILCAGGRDQQDACSGDSGGPLLAEYTDNGLVRIIQYGIVSIGPKICGRQNFPTVFTKVEKYVGWILDNLKP